VNIVLLFSINNAKQEILIEQWEFSHAQNHAGTRLHLEKIPTCSVSFTIALGDASAPAASTSVEHSEPDPSEPTTHTLVQVDLSESAAVAPVDHFEPPSVGPVDPPKPDSLALTDPSNPPAPLVMAKAMKLNVEKVFARRLRKNSSEKDILFTTLDLSKWACKVWPPA